MKAQILSNEAFKNDPITKAIDDLNKVLDVYGYKCDGISIKPKDKIHGSLYVVDGFIVTQETYQSIKGGNR